VRAQRAELRHAAEGEQRGAAQSRLSAFLSACPLFSLLPTLWEPPEPFSFKVLPNSATEV